MSSPAADLARRLARNAEAVCRHYLSNGRREGRYWLVGDVTNTKGRSLFVRLSGPDHGKGAAGHWTDSATGEHGDLLDLIALNRGLDRLRDTLNEARAFLALPPAPLIARQDRYPAPRGSPESARRLYAISRPIMGTLAQSYLHNRGITTVAHGDPLRFHPHCYYRPDEDSPIETWPALIAAVTDPGGTITGAHRTWLDPSGHDKAPIASPRRAMGHLLGHGVRFGVAHDVMAAGEGIETMLSLRMILPTLPMVAALSANHLAALLLPSTLRRLYVARDADPAGDAAKATLCNRADAAGIEPFVLSPCFDDFNDDLRRLGIEGLRASVRRQLVPQDMERFLASAVTG
ncbi:MAG: toprim domain-containing protein [Rhodospirillales bacterium]|nr:MAG: toprim domain-containing protein [Rhodospirillales bacterium]